MIKYRKIYAFGVFKTNYIIFDLEFNSTKNTETGGFINEIIEIGAVKLNEKFEETESFSSVIKPYYTKRLNPYVKKLTHIVDSDLKNSKRFQEVIEEFTDWCNSDKNTVFLSWSDTDLHVLVENYSQVLRRERVDFIKNYVDLQKYVMSFLEVDNGNQISLLSAAESFNIPTDGFSLHRAEDDSRVCGRLLGITYKKEIFKKHIRNTKNPDFYRRLLFKPFIITDLKKAKIKSSKLYYRCPNCSKKLRFSGKYNKKANAFTELRNCTGCKKKLAVSFKFKQNFDNVEIKKRIKPFISKQNRENKNNGN